MPETDRSLASRGPLGVLPRKRLALTPERCSMCGQDIRSGQRYVRLMVGPTHTECRPGWAVDEESGG